MKNRNRFGYLFIAPYFIVFTIFSLYPIFLSLYMSFTNYEGFGSAYDADIVGFANYSRLLQDEYFWASFFNTVKIWGANIIVQITLALVLAVIFTDIKLKMKGVSFFRALFYLPNLITISSVALLFMNILDWQYGPLNAILLKLNIVDQPIYWLGEPITAQLSVAGIQTWLWFGSTFIMLLAGMSGISRDYLEAAMVDGANSWNRFSKITLPLLKPIMLYIAITSLIGGLQLFEMPLLITNGIGAPEGSLVTMVLYLYNKAFRYYDVGYAAAIAYGLFIIIAIFSAIVYNSMFKEEKEAR